MRLRPERRPTEPRTEGKVRMAEEAGQPRDFAANVIGFYLELEDRTAAVVERAGQRYDAWVSQLISANDRLTQSMQQGLDMLARDTLVGFPQQLTDAYDAAVGALQRRITANPLSVTVAAPPGDGTPVNARMQGLVAGINQRAGTLIDRVSQIHGAIIGLFGAQPIDQQRGGRGAVSGTAERAVVNIHTMLTRWFLANNRFQRRVDHLRAAIGGPAASEAIGAAGRNTGAESSAMRFIALNTALKSINEMFKGWRNSGAASFLNEFGVLEHASGVVTSLDKTNRALHLTRAQLMEQKQITYDTAKEISAMPGVVGSAYEEMVRAGYRVGDQMQRTLPIVARVADATNISMDTAAQGAMAFQKRIGLTENDFADFAASVERSATKIGGEFKADGFIEQFQRALPDAGRFAALNRDAKLATIQAIQTMTAAVSGSLVGDQGRQAGKSMMDTVMLAYSAKPEDQTKFAERLMLFGMSRDEFMAELSKGGTGAINILQTMQNRLAHMPLQQQALWVQNAKMADVISQDALTNLANGQIDFAAKAREATSAMVAEGQGMNVLGEMAANNKTWFDKLAVSVSSTVLAFKPFGNTSIGAMFGTLREINPQGLASTVYLTKELGGALNKVNPLRLLSVFRSAGSKEAVATTEALAGKAAGADKAAAATGGLGASIGALARGLAAFANPLTIVGTAVATTALSALILATGAGLGLASSALIPVKDAIIGIAGAVAEIAKSGFEHIHGIFTEFMHLDKDKMLTASFGMAGIGGGLTLLAIGFGAMSAPSTWIGIAAMGLLARAIGSVGTSWIDGINTLAMQFAAIDAGPVAAATRNIGGVALFMAAFAGLGLGMGIVGAGAVAFSTLDWMVSLFADGGAMGIMQRAAGSIVTTINSISVSMGGLNEATAKTAAAKIGGVAEFLKGVISITSKVGEIAGGGVISRTLNTIAASYGVPTETEAALQRITDINTIVTRGLDYFVKTADASPAVLQAGLEGIRRSGTFINEFAKISGSISAIEGTGVFSRLITRLADSIGMQSETEAALSRVRGIGDIMNTALPIFKTVAEKHGGDIDKAMGGVKQTASFIAAVGEASSAVEKLTPGAMERVLDRIGNAFGAQSSADAVVSKIKGIGPIMDAGVEQFGAIADRNKDQIAKALMGIDTSTKFVRGFSDTLSQLDAIKGTGVFSRRLEQIAQWFGSKTQAQAVVDRVKGVGDVMAAAMRIFLTINKNTKASEVKKATAGMQTSLQFARDVSGVVNAYSDIKGTGVLSRMGETLAQWYGAQDRTTAAITAVQRTTEVMNAAINAFAPVGTDDKKKDRIKNAAEGLKYSGEFIREFSTAANVVSSIEDTAPLNRIMNSIADFYTKSDKTQAAIASIQGVGSIVNAAINQFGALYLQIQRNKTNFDTAGKGAKLAMDFIAAFAPAVNMVSSLEGTKPLDRLLDLFVSVVGGTSAKDTAIQNIQAVGDIMNAAIGQFSEIALKRTNSVAHLNLAREGMKLAADFANDVYNSTLLFESLSRVERFPISAERVATHTRDIFAIVRKFVNEGNVGLLTPDVMNKMTSLRDTYSLIASTFGGLNDVTKTITSFRADIKTLSIAESDNADLSQVSKYLTEAASVYETYGRLLDKRAEVRLKLQSIDASDMKMVKPPELKSPESVSALITQQVIGNVVASDDKTHTLLQQVVALLQQMATPSTDGTKPSPVPTPRDVDFERKAGR